MFIFSPALLTGFNWVGRDTDSLGLVAAVISCYGRCAPNARGVIQQWSRVRNMTWDFFPVLCKHGFGDAEDVTCRLLWRPTTSLTHILADMAAEMSRRASRIPPHDIYGGSRVPNVGDFWLALRNFEETHESGQPPTPLWTQRLQGALHHVTWQHVQQVYEIASRNVSKARFMTQLRDLLFAARHRIRAVQNGTLNSIDSEFKQDIRRGIEELYSRNDQCQVPSMEDVPDTLGELNEKVQHKTAEPIEILAHESRTCAELWGIDVHEEGFEKKMTLIKTTFKMKVWDKTFRARIASLMLRVYGVSHSFEDTKMHLRIQIITDVVKAIGKTVTVAGAEHTIPQRAVYNPFTWYSVPLILSTEQEDLPVATPLPSMETVRQAFGLLDKDPTIGLNGPSAHTLAVALQVRSKFVCVAWTEGCDLRAGAQDPPVRRVQARDDTQGPPPDRDRRRAVHRPHLVAPPREADGGRVGDDSVQPWRHPHGAPPERMRDAPADQRGVRPGGPPLRRPRLDASLVHDRLVGWCRRPNADPLAQVWKPVGPDPDRRRDRARSEAPARRRRRS